MTVVFDRRAALRAALCLSAMPALAPTRALAAAPLRLALIESLSGPFANTGEAVYRNLSWADRKSVV